MDLLKEVVDCFSLFLKTVHESRTDTDFDLWKAVKVSEEQSLAAGEVLICLEKLITQLQTVQEELIKKSLQKQENQPDNEIEVNDSKDITDHSSSHREQITDRSESSSSSMKSSTLQDKDSTDRVQSDNVVDKNPNIIQIKASKDEIERRICAFIEKKQREVNQLNNREFCSVITPDSDAEFSCARADAVFVPRAGCKSHIKISRVVNPYGPQTVSSNEGQSLRLDVNERGCQSESTGLEERLKNIESHLQLQLAGVSKADLYSRLKTLEDRILFLEGLSPEYFQNVPPPKRQKMVEEPRKQKDPMQDLSLQEIDERIQSLQASLQKKNPITASWGD